MAKNKINRKKIYVMLVILMGIMLITVEIIIVYLDKKIHKQEYGHYINYGELHTDVDKYELDKTIGLNNAVYSVAIKNYTFFPMMLKGYRVKYNFEQRESSIILLPYKREKFDRITSKWLESDFVDPSQTYNLEKETVVLFPFQSICVIDFDSPFLDKSFQSNDIFRYDIFLDSNFGFSQQHLLTSSFSVR